LFLPEKGLLIWRPDLPAGIIPLREFVLLLICRSENPKKWLPGT
jgi:hypothetical protein